MLQARRRSPTAARCPSCARRGRWSSCASHADSGLRCRDVEACRPPSFRYGECSYVAAMGPRVDGASSLPLARPTDVCTRHPPFLLSSGNRRARGGQLVHGHDALRALCLVRARVEADALDERPPARVDEQPRLAPCPPRSGGSLVVLPGELVVVLRGLASSSGAVLPLALRRANSRLRFLLALSGACCSPSRTVPLLNPGDGERTCGGAGGGTPGRIRRTSCQGRCSDASRVVIPRVRICPAPALVLSGDPGGAPSARGALRVRP